VRLAGLVQGPPADSRRLLADGMPRTTWRPYSRPALLGACLLAYGQEAPDGRWQLRAEDQPDVRRAECATIVDGLAGFGRRLGYRSAARPPFDVAWYRAGQLHAVLQCAGRPLSAICSSRPKRARRAAYLVIPGGRSALVSLKLARNPEWQASLMRRTGASSSTATSATSWRSQTRRIHAAHHRRPRPHRRARDGAASSLLTTLRSRGLQLTCLHILFLPVVLALYFAVPRNGAMAYCFSLR